MDSGDSDNEPLATLATIKHAMKEKQIKLVEWIDEHKVSKVRKAHKHKRKKEKREKIKLEVGAKNLKLPGNGRSRCHMKTEIQRPMDVWLYMKDLNPSGPYSCLLCLEWFINRSKLVIHYILNHKKEYCGICRYFVADRQTWITHWEYHIPMQCSHCSEKFLTDRELRMHFSEAHLSVHCRLCYFMMVDGKEYSDHLAKKHNVLNVANRDKEILWEIEYDGCPKFTCALCERTDIQSLDFFRHYMCYHRFTLKCLSSILAGRDVPFSIFGANISDGFLHNELSEHIKFGYVDREQKPFVAEHSQNAENSLNLLQALIPEIKQETLSDTEDIIKECDDVNSKCQDIANNMLNTDNICHNGRYTNANMNIEINGDTAASLVSVSVSISNYEGHQDFDVTSTELIMIFKSEVDYVDKIINNLNASAMPYIFNINYDQKLKGDDITCYLCEKTINVQAFCYHMVKIHFFKNSPQYSCRLCCALFNSEAELHKHMGEENLEFENLYICQFCPSDFSSRLDARTHLSSHWQDLWSNACTSPQLGFKCRYCFQLFWNENDRERHHCQSHYANNREEFYKCSDCMKVFSDKVWFIHHYWRQHGGGQSGSSCKYILKCTLCCLVFARLHQLREHFDSWHSEHKKFYCTLCSCSRPFANIKSLKIHVKNMHRTAGEEGEMREGGVRACVVCGREFASARAAGAHMALAHGAGRYKCKLCEETLQSADERKLHYLLKHPGRAPFECGVCGKTFQNKSSLYMHRSHYHILNRPTYTCQYCNKLFTKKDSYREHVLIHAGPRHACSFCPARFVQRSNMLRHERRHTGERPYACVHCGRAFADKGACTSHMRTHTRDQVHTCPYCGQTFAQKPKLKYHIRRHTGENLETCHVCSKLFTSVCSLREHMRIHDKSEKAECRECGKVFTSTRYMVRHMRSSHATGGELYACPVCEKLLATTVRLRQHVLTHSKIKGLQCLTCSKRYCGRKSMLKHLRIRHGIKGTNETLKTCYSQLDPRQCRLGLDEDIITKIFGPAKLINTDVVISDYVTFPSELPVVNVTQGDNNLDEGEMKDNFSVGALLDGNESSTGSEMEQFDEEPIPVELVKRKNRTKAKIITYNYGDAFHEREDKEESRATKKKKKRKNKKRKAEKQRLETAIEMGEGDLVATDFLQIKTEPVEEESE